MRELQRYQDEQILTSPPERLIQLLLIRAVADLTGAEQATDATDRRDLVRHAQDIVTELRCCLNLDAGELASQLDQLYGFVDRELSTAYTADDPTRCTAARQVLAEILDGWKAVVHEAPGLRQSAVTAG